MPKDIVILCDGTSNEISANRTNVLRLYGCLRKTEAQLVWYDPGVGTFGSDNSWFRLRRRSAELLGLLTGWGLDQNVKEAYRFLVERWEPGDRIWLVGFSRGAYTVRVLAGFIAAIGLMTPVQLNLLDYAFRAYKRANGDDIDSKEFSEVRLFRRILQPRDVPLAGLALFDTVASVIEWGRYLPRLRSHALTRSNPAVAAVRHAVALQERRVMFRPQLWKLVPGQNLREVWFLGAHGDVGGGYPEAELALAKIPLAWMIGELRGLGLRFDTAVVDNLVCGEGPGRHVGPDPTAAPHRTMTWAWSILELVPARRRSRRDPDRLEWYLPLGQPRDVPADASVHHSVFESGRPVPPNLPPGPRSVD